ALPVIDLQLLRHRIETVNQGSNLRRPWSFFHARRKIPVCHSIGCIQQIVQRHGHTAQAQRKAGNHHQNNKGQDECEGSKPLKLAERKTNDAKSIQSKGEDSSEDRKGEEIE